MFFNFFLTLISHHQQNQFLQAGDADYLTFGGHKLYESDYLRSLQWHGIGKDSSLQGRCRMRGGKGGKGRGKKKESSSVQDTNTQPVLDAAATAAAAPVQVRN
jgi:hypothetical protein